MLWARKKFSDFGIGWSSNSFIFIGQLALCTWGLDFVPFKLLEIYSKGNCRGILDLFDLIF